MFMPVWLVHLPQRLLIASVRGYRLLLSAWLGTSCRFEPSCSAYALRALADHGAAAGSYLSVHRLLRCAPWCAGGHDPVPATAPRLFRFLCERPPRPAATSSTSNANLNP
jgi:putative membrane protein insertion efficiency factor